jgi:hypothetical protein
MDLRGLANPRKNVAAGVAAPPKKRRFSAKNSLKTANAAVFHAHGNPGMWLY